MVAKKEGYFIAMACDYLSPDAIRIIHHPVRLNNTIKDKEA